LRNFCREELFGSALKIFVYLFIVVRHLQPPNLQPPRFAGDASAVKTGTKCTSRHRNASWDHTSIYKCDIGIGPTGMKRDGPWQRDRNLAPVLRRRCGVFS
jgi:hypothetical protein